MLRRMGQNTAALACCAAIMGCSATLPEVVRVPVPVPCVKEAPDKPETMTKEALIALAREDQYGATLQVVLDWLALKSYAERADALLQACR